MNKVYKFRMYPTAEQKKYLAKTFGCVRFVYNRMLADKFEKKKFVSLAKYKEEFEWLAEVDSLALCNAQMTVTISKTPTNEYYVSILIEYESQVQKIVPKSFVGLDYSMRELCVSSDGYKPKYPKFYRRSEKKLSKVQRKFSRKVNYNLIAKYDCICVEDLNMQGMSQALKFGKSVHDNGWGMFRQMLEYKCEWFGKTFIKIDKFEPSSQKCHCCGYKNSATKDLNVRNWRCPKCGAYHDRDINAAINIREAGKKLI